MGLVLGGGDIDDGQGALVYTYTRYLVQNVEKLGRWMTHQFRYWTFLNHWHNLSRHYNLIILWNFCVDTRGHSLLLLLQSILVTIENQFNQWHIYFVSFVKNFTISVVILSEIFPSMTMQPFTGDKPMDNNGMDGNSHEYPWHQDMSCQESLSKVTSITTIKNMK